MHKCNVCKKEFAFNYLFQRHLNNKKPCYNPERLLIKYEEQIRDIDNQIDKLFESSIKSITICGYCKKTFYKKANLERHIDNSCIAKKKLLQNKDEIIILKNKLSDEINNIQMDETIDKMNDEIISMKREMESLRDIKNNVIHQQIINNNVTNQVNNITINVNSFGREKISHISDDEYAKFLNDFFAGYLKFIEKIHFDENTPENHNLCLTNMNSRYIYVYEKNNWVLKEKNEIVNKLMTRKYNLLSDKFEEFEENNKIKESVLENFREFQGNYNNTEAKKNTKNSIMLLLYNNREKVKR